MILSFRVGTSINKSIDHRGKAMCAMFDLPIQKKNSSINDSFPFLVNFFELEEKDYIERKTSSKKLFV